MWEMFNNSLQLFLKGKLFKEPAEVLKKWLVGVAIAAVLIVVLGTLLPLWLAVVIAALLTGAAQPYLFKDLKYA